MAVRDFKPGTGRWHTLKRVGGNSQADSQAYAQALTKIIIDQATHQVELPKILLDQYGQGDRHATTRNGLIYRSSASINQPIPTIDIKTYCQVQIKPTSFKLNSN